MKLSSIFATSLLTIVAAGSCSMVGAKEHQRHLRRDLSSNSDKGGDRGGRTFTAIGSGDQEVPAISSDTSARVRLSFDAGYTEVNYKVQVFDGKAITQIHLHCGMAGSNGPLIAILFNVAPTAGPGGVDLNGKAESGFLTNEDINEVECGNINISNVASLQEAVLQRMVYLNVHSEANPSGEVRGQFFL